MASANSASYLASANALTQAAELALATDHTDRGFDLVTRAVDQLVTPVTTGWPTVRTALLGALIDRVHTRLFKDGIELKDQRQGGSQLTNWSAPAVICDRTAGPLIAAALASGPPAETLSLLLGPPSAENPQAWMGFVVTTKAMEADLFPAFGLFRRPDGEIESNHVMAETQLAEAAACFIALHQRYAARLRLLASDTTHWHELRPRAPLIDWTLLGLHIALQRSEDAMRNMQRMLPKLQPSRLNEIRNFMGAVASEMIDIGRR